MAGAPRGRPPPRGPSTANSRGVGVASTSQRIVFRAKAALVAVCLLSVLAGAAEPDPAAGRQPRAGAGGKHAEVRPGPSRIASRGSTLRSKGRAAQRWTAPATRWAGRMRGGAPAPAPRAPCAPPTLAPAPAGVREAKDAAMAGIREAKDAAMAGIREAAQGDRGVRGCGGSGPAQPLAAVHDRHAVPACGAAAAGVQPAS